MEFARKRTVGPSLPPRPLQRASLFWAAARDGPKVRAYTLLNQHVFGLPRAFALLILGALPAKFRLS